MKRNISLEYITTATQMEGTSGSILANLANVQTHLSLTPDPSFSLSLFLFFSSNSLSFTFNLLLSQLPQ